MGWIMAGTAAAAAAVSAATSAVLATLSDRGPAGDASPPLVEVLARLEQTDRLAGAYYSDDPRARRMLDWWKGGGTVEELSSKGQRPGYTVAKRRVKVCLRDAADGKPFDPDVAFFVTLHEVAHVATVQQQHPPEFWDNMRFVLQMAILAGTHVHVDYSNSPVTFCGHYIDATPLKCEAGSRARCDGGA